MPTGDGNAVKRSIEKIPGGMMLVPLFLGHCATPSRRGRGNILDHSPTGDYRYGAHSGGVVFLHGGVNKLSATGTVLRKSGTLVVTKIPSRGWLRQLPRALFRNMVLNWILCRTFNAGAGGGDGYDQRGLYASIMQQYGTKEEAGAFC